MRVLAIDWGVKRTGLAICDELGLTVRPLTTLHGASRKLIPQIANLVIEHEVEQVVVGLPLGANGGVGDAALRVQAFVDVLKATLTCPVVTWNERLTSYAADEWMKEQGYSSREREQRSDEIAAAILLEDYLSVAGKQEDLPNDA